MANQVIRTNVLTIPNKLRCDMRLFISDRGNPEYRSKTEGNSNLTLSTFPGLTISIIRPTETDEDGKRIRPVMNRNDSLSLNKYHYPIFVTELKGIYDDMKKPNLYQYHGKRLEINEAEAERIRRVMVIGLTTVEISAIVTLVPNQLGEEERKEGIKLKFNNEESSVCLTVNDMTSLVYTLEHLDLDSMAVLLYSNFADRNKLADYGSQIGAPIVDIQPKDILPKAE